MHVAEGFSLSVNPAKTQPVLEISKKRSDPEHTMVNYDEANAADSWL